MWHKRNVTVTLKDIIYLHYKIEISLDSHVTVEENRLVYNIKSRKSTEHLNSYKTNEHTQESRGKKTSDAANHNDNFFLKAPDFTPTALYYTYRSYRCHTYSYFTYNIFNLSWGKQLARLDVFAIHLRKVGQVASLLCGYVIDASLELVRKQFSCRCTRVRYTTCDHNIFTAGQY